MQKRSDGIIAAERSFASGSSASLIADSMSADCHSAGTELQVKTERPEVTLSLAEMDKGSRVIFDPPGFAKAASGTQKGSMDALRKASETSWFKNGNDLW